MEWCPRYGGSVLVLGLFLGEPRLWGFLEEVWEGSPNLGRGLRRRTLYKWRGVRVSLWNGVWSGLKGMLGLLS